MWEDVVGVDVEEATTGQWSEYIEMPDILEGVRSRANGILGLGRTEEHLCGSRGYQRSHRIEEGALNPEVLRKAT